MLNRHLNIILFLLFFFVGVFYLQTGIAEDQNPIVAVTHWPPWKVIDGDNYDGIDILIVEELGKRLNLTFQYTECPWKRCLELMKSGQTDFIFGIAKHNRREEYMTYITPPYREKFSSAFYTRKNKGSRKYSIQVYEDLYNKEVGVIRGGLYFNRFDLDSDIIKVAVSNEIQLLEMLELGRLDVIIGNELNIDYLIMTHGFSSEIDKSTFKVDSFTPTYIAISKKSKFLYIITEMKEVLVDMLKSNRIQEIERAYKEKTASN